MENERKYFCQETQKHQISVSKKIGHLIKNLVQRAASHDNSKFSEEEADLFIKMTPLLRQSTYGSEEYKQFLKELTPALDHHYQTNSHHPEHYENGIKDMDLIDLIEMLCDWYAATERHEDGNIFKSIEINQERFCYSDELKSIFINTIIRQFPAKCACVKEVKDEP